MPRKARRRSPPHREATYQKETKYRSAFICPGCYTSLDSFPFHHGAIAGRVFNMSCVSSRGKAALYTEAKYRAFQRRKAAEMGIEA
jgi:hypothetical protein